MSVIYKIKRSLSKDKGVLFEIEATKAIKKAFKGKRAYVLSDLLLVDDKKRRSQIDNIVITGNHLYIIEIKQKYGTITDFDSEQLLQTLDIKTKHLFRRPSIQNESHIRFVDYLLKPKLKVVNLVIYSNDAVLNMNDGISINLKDLFKLVNKLEILKTKSNEKKEYYKIIKKANKNNVINRFLHLRYIKRKKK